MCGFALRHLQLIARLLFRRRTGGRPMAPLARIALSGHGRISPHARWKRAPTQKMTRRNKRDDECRPQHAVRHPGEQCKVRLESWRWARRIRLVLLFGELNQLWASK
jgi:hypothetical protein